MVADYGGRFLSAMVASYNVYHASYMKWPHGMLVEWATSAPCGWSCGLHQYPLWGILPDVEHGVEWCVLVVIGGGLWGRRLNAPYSRLYSPP
jgi:hypothetical protein